MEKELLDCPFCGGRPQLKQDCRNGYTLKCTVCLVSFRQKVLRQTMEWLKGKMIERWNMRVK